MLEKHSVLTRSKKNGVKVSIIFEKMNLNTNPRLDIRVLG